MSDDEIEACAEIIVRTAPSKSSVILNVTPQATVTAVRRAKEFERMGAHAVMVLPPFTVPVPVDLLEMHLEEVLGAAELPWIVQDSAGLTGVNLNAQSLARLKASRPLFSALKVDQVPTGPAISSYRAVPALAGLSFIVGYSGVQMLDAVRRGAEGLMGGCGHLAEDRRMLEALFKGNGYEEFARLAPLLNFEMQTLELVIAVHKQLLYEAGVIATPLNRAPSRAMDQMHVDELRMHLTGAGRQ